MTPVTPVCLQLEQSICTLQGDVRELKDCEGAIQAITDKWGRLDILINAAAGNFLTPAEVLTPKGFKTGLPLIAHVAAIV